MLQRTEMASFFEVASLLKVLLKRSEMAVGWH
jgi:hypothetical protein